MSRERVLKTNHGLRASCLLVALLVLMVCLGFAPALALATNVGLYGELSADGTTLTYKYGEHEGPVWKNETATKWTPDRKSYSWVYAPGSSWYLSADQAEKVTRIVVDASVKEFKPKTLIGMFSQAREGESLERWTMTTGYKNVRSIDGLGYLNTSQCEDMNGLFAGCDSLSSLDLSSFDTSKCTNMNGMLQCQNLKSFKVGSKFKFVGLATDYVVPAQYGWRSSVDRKLYTSKSLPSNVAATYTAEKLSGRTLQRLYNPNSGEHFYTSNLNEMSNLRSVGWKYEGAGWVAPNESNTPVYRLYNPYAGEHHYTVSKNERDQLVRVGWKDEGIGWYSDDDKGAPLYRLYNPNAFANNHHYTRSTNERDTLLRLGWRDEGIAWYGWKTD